MVGHIIRETLILFMRGGLIVLSKGIGATSKQEKKYMKINIRSNCPSRFVISLDKNCDRLVKKHLM